MIGPFEGTVNDWQMYLEEGASRRLERMMTQPGRRTIYLYGDAANHNCEGIMAPYRSNLGFRHVVAEARAFNRPLSSVRISVEHSFGEITRKWTYNSFGMQLRSGQQPVAAYLFASVLLTNCWTCLNHNQTSRRYRMDPPGLEEYLGVDASEDSEAESASGEDTEAGGDDEGVTEAE